MSLPGGIPPAVRVGQCGVIDSEKNRLIIAYGCDASGNCLNDAWSLDLKTLRWQLLARSLLSPREYPSAILIDRRMYIFGGACNLTFYADLHYIDIDTGQWAFIQTTADSELPRTAPAFFSIGDRLFVWSGYNGSALGDLYSVNRNGGQWIRKSQELAGRAAPSCCTHDGRVYIFGSTKGMGLAVFNPATEQFENVPTLGTAPVSTLNHTAMVSVDRYLFVIGGKAGYGYMHLFALDVERNWWFAFHVRPDGKTVKLSDGVVCKLGLFMMPRQHACYVGYSKENRELVNVMGSRMADPAPVYKIEVGQALGVLHLRTDMYEMHCLLSDIYVKAM
jgi:hypothetical protein